MSPSGENIVKVNYLRKGFCQKIFRQELTVFTRIRAGRDGGISWEQVPLPLTIKSINLSKKPGPSFIG